MQRSIAVGLVAVVTMSLGLAWVNDKAIPAAAVGRVAADDVASDAAAVTVDAAIAQAVQTGEPVVASELTTPIEQTTAMPDGSLQYEVSSVPVRTLQNERWVPVDTTLVAVDGWLAPHASAAMVRFSAGGDNALDMVQSPEGGWITETWPHGPLPVPSVSGATATYPEVLPGVDLKLTATETGMRSVYVVKSQTAALAEVLADLHVTVEGGQLLADAVGTYSIDAGAADGLTAASPLWWDSSEGGTAAGPGGDLPELPVTHSLLTTGLSLDVGTTVQGVSSVTYPVYVDPDWSSGITSSWYTDKAFPSQSYLAASSSDVLRVGISSPYWSHMFFQFPLPALSGKKIVKATLNTTQIAALSCPSSAIDVKVFGPKTAGFSWNTEHTWTGQWGPVLESKSPGGCHSASMAVGWNVTNGVAAEAGASMIQLGFIQHDSTANNSRRHYSRKATLVINYDSRPSAPTSPTMTSPPRDCGTATAPAAVGAASVTVRVNQKDPDGGNVGTNFYLAKASALSTVVQQKASGMGAQGDKSVTFIGLVDGTTYAWRARGYDGIVDDGAYSAWCYFTVDTTKPAVPTITPPTGMTYTVGQPVTVNISGASDVAGYVYWVQLSASTPTVPQTGQVGTSTALPDCSKLTSEVRFRCGAGSTPVPVTVAPVDSLSYLWVSAYDKAGNQSAPAGLALYGSDGAATAASPDPRVQQGHGWDVAHLPSPLPLAIDDANTAASPVGLLLPDASWTSATDVSVYPFASPVLSVPSSAAATAVVKTSAAPLNAASSFTWSMWVKPTSSADQLVASQVGTGRGRVELQISGGMWAFCLLGAAASDDNGRPVSGCAKGGTVTADTRTLVTGIWDASNQQLRLLIGNSTVPRASAAHVVGSGDWSAAGAMSIAPAAPTGWTRFSGTIVNPAVLPGVIDSNQLFLLSTYQMPFNG